jgi:phytoene dehydrogenase-like protein
MVVETTSRPRSLPAAVVQELREAKQTRYDAVVVGGGIAGLTCAALLAHAGKKVVLVEAEDAPGGCARAHVRGPYTFDRADHLIWGCDPDGPFGPGLVDAVLRHLEVRDRCEFLRRDDPVYEARFPGLTVPVPAGREEFLDAHLRYFPGEAAGLRRLAALAADVYRESRTFPVTPRASDLAAAGRRWPTLLRYRSATLQEVVDDELSDPRLKSLYTTLWSWVGLPPSQSSFLMWSILLAGYVEDGAYACRGGFQSLADALAAGLVEAGGELVLGTEVSRIEVDRKRVSAVVLATGQRVHTRWVVCTNDPRDAFRRLVGVQHLPSRLVRRMRDDGLSLSVFLLYAATDLDIAGLGTHRDVILSADWDPERTYEVALRGEVTNLSILIPTLADDSLAPPGEHLVILKAVAADQAGLGGDDDETRADRMLALCERVLPDLRRRLTYLDQVPRSPTTSATPLHHMGPIYGWAGSPAHVGQHRLAPRTPVGRLLLAGQWTQPGPGVCTVVRSGLSAARIVLGNRVAATALPHED